MNVKFTIQNGLLKGLKLGGGLVMHDRLLPNKIICPNDLSSLSEKNGI